jgi:hypothetical protein
VPCDDRGCIACAPKRACDRDPATPPIALTSFCAICIDGAIGLRLAQLEPGGPVFTICQRCDESSASHSRGYHGIREWRGPSLRGWSAW